MNDLISVSLVCAVLCHSVISCSASKQTLPTPLPPAHAVPAVADLGPRTPGTARLYLDNTTGPAQVSKVEQRNQGAVVVANDTVLVLKDLEKSTEHVPLCVTPCVVDLPLGPTQLAVRAGDPVVSVDNWSGARIGLNLTDSTSALIVTPAERRKIDAPKRGWGIGLMVFGGVTTAAGIAGAIDGNEDAMGNPQVGAAIAGAAIGAAITGLGYYLFATAKKPVNTYRPQSHSHFLLPGR